MKYERIRAIATSNSGKRFAVAEFEKKIQIWDQQGFIRSFETDYDFGGDRFSISNSGEYLVVGSYEKNSIVNYSIDTGEVVWERGDLRKCGVVRIVTKKPERVFVTLEYQDSHFLLLESGVTIKSMNCVEYWENLLSEHDIMEHRSELTVIDGDFRNIRTKPKATFALLDGFFTRNDFIASFSAGPLEVMGVENLETRWTKKIEGHFLKVGFNKNLNMVLGVGWDYNIGGVKTLYYLNYKNGSIEHQIDLGETIEAKFFQDCEFLITSKGKLVSITEMKVVNEFNFER